MTTYTYTTLIDPSAAPGGSTNPLSINDRGQVVGWYNNGTADVGFLYSDGTYKTLRDPSAGLDGETFPTSINHKGQVAGYYTDGGQTRDFLYSNGTWTTLSEPATAPLYAPSINDSGQVVGEYYNGSSLVGFLYSNGNYTTLSDPSAVGYSGTQPTSINDRGQVVGLYDNESTDQAFGFLYSNGTYTTLSDPSAGPHGDTFPVSINEMGQVTGYYYGVTTEGGFLYSNGTWTNLSDPSAPPSIGATRPVSINDQGQVTGLYLTGTTILGFLYSNGTYTTLSDPSAALTDPTSSNDTGQFTGIYNNVNSTHDVGFIATPTDVDHQREPPKLTVTDHWLSVTASGSVVLPISVKANDTDDTVSVKISGLPSFETITAGDGHTVVKMGNSYTFTLADVQSGLTLHSSFDRKDHLDHDDREHDRNERERSERRLADEQSKLTVTAFNTTHGEYAATIPQAITVTTTPPTDRLAGLFNQYVAGFHNEHDSAGQMISSPDKQGHRENLAFLSNPHH